MNAFIRNINLMFVGVLLMPFVAQGQDINKRYLDSILPILQSYKDTTALVTKTDEICSAIRKKDPNEANELYTYFDQITSDEHVKMAIYHRWGPTLLSIGKVEKSYSIRHKALKLAKKTANENYLVNTNNSLSRYFIGMAIADSASYYTHELEALILNNKKVHGTLLWDVNHLKGEIQRILGNKQKQSYYYEKAWQVMDTLKPKSKQQGFFLYILTEHFQNENDFKKQSFYGNLLVEHYNKEGLTTSKGHFPVETVFLKNNSSEEIQRLKEVIKISKQKNYLGAYATTVGILADSYMKNNASEKAIPYLEALIKKLDSAKYPYNHSRDRDKLQKAYAAIGNYKMAYSKLYEFKKMSDSIRNDEALAKISDFEVKYETEKKEGQIKLLSVENKKNKQLQKLYFILGILGVLLLLFLSFFFIKIRNKNTLLAKQKTLLELSVDEKNILLKETHHRVKNSFQIVSSLLYLQAETIDDKEAKNAMQEAQNRVRSMVLIHQKLYNKDQLVGINTQEYFTDLTVDIFESHQFKDNAIQYTLDIEPLVLDIETITPLGLILNELITNVIKHAFPTVTSTSTMEISFKKEGELLLLEVVDNGQGMPSEIKNSSFGIQLIKALAKKLKATLSFPEKANGGTRARIEIKRFTEL